jgi:DNA invertase Pin-like site-specific DNA recombinase
MATKRNTKRIDKRVAKEKEDLLNALAATSGIVSSACKAANVSRMTYYRYYNEDAEFREKADDIKELQKDFAESLILKKMKEGDTTMIIFYAKTQMKDRGYTERKEITGKDGESLIHKEVDLSKLSDSERELLLRIGNDILNKKE